MCFQLYTKWSLKNLYFSSCLLKSYIASFHNFNWHCKVWTIIFLYVWEKLVQVYSSWTRSYSSNRTEPAHPKMYSNNVSHHDSLSWGILIDQYMIGSLLSKHSKWCYFLAAFHQPLSACQNCDSCQTYKTNCMLEDVCYMYIHASMHIHVHAYIPWGAAPPPFPVRSRNKPPQISKWDKENCLDHLGMWQASYTNQIKQWQTHVKFIQDRQDS